MLRWDVGEGLELRLVERRHADELFALVDANRARLREWLPWVDGARTVADTLGFIEGALRQFADGQGPQLAVCYGGRIAGMTGFHPLDAANRAGEIGYWLGAAAEGRGLMTRACRALVEHGFTELGLHRIVIRAATGNARSRAIPERLGFRHEGTLCDAEWLYDHFVDLAVYALLSGDPRTTAR